jgi:hypothetical protein
MITLATPRESCPSSLRLIERKEKKRRAAGGGGGGGRWQRFPRERVEIRVAEEPDGDDLVVERRERDWRRWPVGVFPPDGEENCGNRASLY